MNRFPFNIAQPLHQVQEVTINRPYLTARRNSVTCLFFPATENVITRTCCDPTRQEGSWKHLAGLPLNPDTVIITKIFWQ